MPTARRNVHSHTAQSLLMDWSDANISCVSMVRTARSCRRDGLSIPMLDKLADCGTDDYLNCYKGFKTLLQRGGVLGMITPLLGPLYRTCLLPSTVFKLLASSPRQFRMRLGADIPAVTAFWNGLFSSAEGMRFKSLHPHLRNMPMSVLRTRIPVRVHEDAGPFTKVKGVNLISWSSLLGHGSELETKHHAIVKVCKN